MPSTKMVMTGAWFIVLSCFIHNQDSLRLLHQFTGAGGTVEPQNPRNHGGVVVDETTYLGPSNVGV